MGLGRVCNTVCNTIFSYRMGLFFFVDVQTIASSSFQANTVKKCQLSRTPLATEICVMKLMLPWLFFFLSLLFDILDLFICIVQWNHILSNL